MRPLLLPTQLRYWQQLIPAARCFRLAFAAFSIALVSLGQALNAQQGLSTLKPPPGARVALVEFGDLECPKCAQVNPILRDAVAKYRIPWLRHDFLIPYHNWSSQAAVNARWFDAQAKHLGNDYRDAVFANQSSIETPSDLIQFTANFAKQHGIALPFAIDPQGTLLNAVKADVALGQSLGVHQTPTVWIVTDRTGGAPPYTQVTDFDKLFVMLDQVTAQTNHAKK
jgi:protein-disulfide isomerase